MTMTAPRRAIVIGSGFGGLALAIRLQAAGIATTILEQRDKPGGRAYVFQDQGFTFDAGPTVITAPDCLEDLFALAGETLADHVDLIPVMPFYRLFWEDGDVFDYSNNLEAVLSQIRKRSPADAEGYLRFVKYSEEVFAAGYIPNGAQWRDVIAFGVLILVLLVRPSGLLGEKIAEKV